MSVAKTIKQWGEPLCVTKINKFIPPFQNFHLLTTFSLDLCHWMQTKAKVVLWQPIRKISVTSRDIDTKKM